MLGGIRVGFHGVRGSTPCDGPQYARYGGQSSCVTVDADGHAPIVFDLGTGLRSYGERCGALPFHGTVLLSHLHWDHVQGLPFFGPLHDPASTVSVFGPRQDGGLGNVFGQMMCPPFFPITPAGLAGNVDFVDTGDDDFPIGDVKVRSRWVRHVGPTLGFRVEVEGATIAYLPDHGPGCNPDDADDFVPDAVLELCDGVDVLIHDAQHTHDEYGPKRHWGHSTVEYALHVARQSGARRLVLFHHDPAHGDADLDLIAVRCADEAARGHGPEVLAAYEGLEIALDAAAAGSRRR